MIKDPSTTSNSPPKKGSAVKIGEASKILGLHMDTLRRWEKSGRITAVRTPGGTRLYSLDELNSLIPKVLDNFSKPPSAKIKQPAKNLQGKDEENIYAHVYNRGVEKRIIFNDGQDYEVFLGFLKEYLTAPKDPDSIKKAFKVHGRTFRGTPHQPKNYFNQIELVAYSLMPNHFHLLLHQITHGSLESFLRSLCTRYSMYFNKKYQHTGALFEGPYKSAQIKGEPRLQQLTRYLHHTGSYSSYPEYLGTRETPWIKSKVILASFDKVTGSYKNFVEKYQLDQNEKELIDDITLESEPAHLERIGFTSDGEIHLDQKPKPRSKINEFAAISSVVFILLVTLGIRNIIISTPPAVLSETKEVSTAPASAVSTTPDAGEHKIILTIKIDEASAKVNIRQKPTTNSELIGEAKDGDTFEYLSKDSDWYEVKLTSGSTGFISAKYIKESEGKN